MNDAYKKWQNEFMEQLKVKSFAERIEKPISEISYNIALNFEKGASGEAVYDTGVRLLSKDGKGYKVGIVIMLDESAEE